MLRTDAYSNDFLLLMTFMCPSLFTDLAALNVHLISFEWLLEKIIEDYVYNKPYIDVRYMYKQEKGREIMKKIEDYRVPVSKVFPMINLKYFFSYFSQKVHMPPLELPLKGDLNKGGDNMNVYGGLTEMVSILFSLIRPVLEVSLLI